MEMKKEWQRKPMLPKKERSEEPSASSDSGNHDTAKK